jgi:hypothetical protein
MEQPADKKSKEKIMGVFVESKGRQGHRRSERTIPFVSGEEMVLITSGSDSSIIGKMMDLSEDGTLVYLSEESEMLNDLKPQCTLTLYHRGRIFQIESKVARASSRLIGFEFVNPSSTVMNRIRAKINEMPDWLRVKGQKPQ